LIRNAARPKLGRVNKAVWIPLAAGIGAILGAAVMRLNAGPVPLTWNAVQVVTAVLALVTAVGAWTLSLTAYRTSYAPIIRPVPAKLPCGALDLGALILKNVGRGTAISLVLVAGRGANASLLLAEVDALEPLGQLYGPAFVEASRVGRRSVEVALQPGCSYRLLFQDSAGDWHETSFTVDAPQRVFRVHLLGRLQPEEVPCWIRERAQLVSA
jgi:hypothetical protein